MKKRQFQTKIIAELLNNYKKRVPTCRHFLRCGGCSLQDFDYQDQLEVKGAKFIELIDNSKQKTQISKPQIKTQNYQIKGINEYGYRTRMDFVVGEGGIGLRKKRRFDEIEYLEECWLIDSKIFPWLKRIYVKGRELDLETYRVRENQGYWRYLSIRVNEKNEVMLIFVTGLDQKQDKIIDELVDWILKERTKSEVKVVSIYHLVNETKSDINFGKVRKYWGEKYLEFVVGGTRLQIGPNNFFQNNIGLFNDLVQKMLGWFGPDDKVLDLYCGVGTFSLPLANKVERVTGVESVFESIELAKENADLNQIKNVEFEASMVDKWLGENKPRANEFNVAVLDPPRVGLEKANEILLDYNLEKIVYVSCNPLALLKDLEKLTVKYNIIDLSLWDLYPQTPHMETLVFLIKK